MLLPMYLGCLLTPISMATVMCARALPISVRICTYACHGNTSYFCVLLRLTMTYKITLRGTLEPTWE